jgi:hypothetical protein
LCIGAIGFKDFFLTRTIITEFNSTADSV